MKVNKIQEGEYILLKKQHATSIPVRSQNRYKVLDKRNEAPDYISNQVAVAAQITGKAVASGFTIGEKEISFTAPSNRDAEDFYNLFNTLSSLQFTNGVYRSAIYTLASGGGGILNTSNSTQVFEATLEEGLLTQDTWLTNKDATVNTARC